MPKTNAETMTVRLPTQVAKELIKLRDDKNLPTIGSALQIYIQKMKEDRITERFDKIERNIGRLAYLLEKETMAFTRETIREILKNDVYGQFVKNLDPEERKELFEAAQEGGDGWAREWLPRLKKFADPIIVEALKKRDKK